MDLEASVQCARSQGEAADALARRRTSFRIYRSSRAHDGMYRKTAQRYPDRDCCANTIGRQMPMFCMTWPGGLVSLCAGDEEQARLLAIDGRPGPCRGTGWCKTSAATCSPCEVCQCCMTLPMKASHRTQGVPRRPEEVPHQRSGGARPTSMLLSPASALRRSMPAENIEEGKMQMPELAAKVRAAPIHETLLPAASLSCLRCCIST